MKIFIFFQKAIKIARSAQENRVGWVSGNIGIFLGLICFSCCFHQSIWTEEWCKFYVYRKFPKYSDTKRICCNHSKIWTMWLYHRVMSQSDGDGMANSVDPDQTAPLGAVWSGSALFAQAYLSENLGSLRYFACSSCCNNWSLMEDINKFSHERWQILSYSFLLIKF